MAGTFYSGKGLARGGGGGSSSFSFSKTADVASATTITAPEPGFLVPVTGSTQIDFLTKPTGDAPRLILLWFQAGTTVRNNVAGAPGGAANIRLMPGAAVNAISTFAADGMLPLQFDGTVWRMAQDGPHWDGAAIVGVDPAARLVMNGAIGSRLEYNTISHSISFDGARCTLTDALFRMTTRPRFDQGSVASAGTITLPANCGSVLITGTTTVNAIVSTGWELGCVVYLTFNGILTLTHNSGAACDIMSKTGANITTAAGMVIPFRFDGTDFVEVGR